MSDDLRKLIEAVEAEDTRPWHEAIPLLGIKNATFFGAAQCGSLDDAVVLLEALLPGWDWSMHGNGQATLWPPGTIDEQNKGAIETYIVDQPARALLLAVLRAKLMEASHE